MIEILTIGTEILQGFTLNRNVTFLSHELLKEGFVVRRHTTVSDEFEDLKNGLQEACKRSSLVITTGGLGPTEDDVTRQAVCEVMDTKPHFDQVVADDLKERFGPSLKSLEDQATVPGKAHVILNKVGTAPGFIFESDNVTLVMLPGVPNEMKPIFNHDILPYLKESFPIQKRLFRKRLHLIRLIESEVDPLYRKLSKQHPDINFSIYPSHGLLTLDLSMYGESEKETFKHLMEPVSQFTKEFGSYVYESPSGKIEEAIQNRFVSNNWTLSTAESCTGGTIASRITHIPGSSDYFLGSLVTYANRLKSDLLGVDPQVIQEKGTVSEEVVCQMVTGLLQKTGSDYGIAVSGIAGPSGGTKEKPVGTVWAAIGNKNTVYPWKMQLRGTREIIIDYTVNAVLGELYLKTYSDR